MQNPNEIKERIMYFLKARGPSLPVHISTEIKTSILFSSAFLGELFSEKRVKMSNLRVGSSPLYFLPGQEASLENFSQHLKSKEKDAFLLLKEKKFLRDSEQNPAIRVALREIKDFAVPFKSGEEIVWRYFLAPQEEFKTVEEKPIKVEEKKEPAIEEKTEEESKKTELKKPRQKRKAKPKEKYQQKDELFSKVKSFLAENKMELKDVLGFTKNEILLKIAENDIEKILVAYNKKKISDKEIVRAHKKVSSLGLPCIVLGIGDPAKKTSELMKAMKDLSSVHGIK